MSGYDKSRIIGVSENELDEFTCCICQDILKDPVMAKCCRQIYCTNCIRDWLENNRTCPNDRKEMTASNLSEVPRLVTNLLNNMQITCEFEEKGCEVITTISQLSSHMKQCDYNPNKKCKNCDQIKVFGKEHDCITNLVIKNKSLADQVKRLSKKVEELEKENKVVGMKSIIKSARSSINDFTIGEPLIGINMVEQKILVEKCKRAIMNNDSFKSICYWLSSVVNRSLPDVKNWNVNAFSPEGGETLVYSERYIRNEFNQVIIEIFTAADKIHNYLF